MQQVFIFIRINLYLFNKQAQQVDLNSLLN